MGKSLLLDILTVRLALMSNVFLWIFNKSLDCVNGSFAHVAVAAMRSVVVVGVEPFIEVDL